MSFFSFDPSVVDAEALTVEPTGPETRVVAHFALNEIMGAFRARNTTQLGQMLKIRAEGNSVHLFDAE